VSGLGSYVRARLHRRIFMWFGMTIVSTGIAVGVVMAILGGSEHGGWRRDVDRATAFAGGRFERVWDRPVERDELAASMAQDLDVDVRVVDPRGATLAQHGQSGCKHPWRVPVTREGAALGSVEVCAERHHMFAFGPRVLAALAIAGALIWMASGKIARRLSKPIAEVARVAGEIGAGNFAARVNLGGARRGHRGHPRHYGEVAALGVAIDTMAGRIEKQFRDQRELLATVSHEIRTPLARIRLLLELARERGTDDPGLSEIDRECVEMDALVAELLASSRVEFSALTKTKLDAAEAAKRALDRAALPATLLVDEASGASALADATLLARALANLLDNAKAHGGGPTALRVRAQDEGIVFEVEDRGPGFEHGEEARVFEPFVRGAASNGERASLGLGLALVRRIAEAHGGRAFAEPRDGGGARVGIVLPR
jgi:signal transduction histidine kinase